MVGLDVADPGLLAEWEKRAHEKIEFVAGLGVRPALRRTMFDLVSASRCSSTWTPERALTEMARVSRRGMLVSVPREPVWRGMNMRRGAHWRSFGNTPGHINHWTRRGFVALAGTAGEVVAVRRPFPWTMVAVHVRP